MKLVIPALLFCFCSGFQAAPQNVTQRRKGAFLSVSLGVQPTPFPGGYSVNSATFAVYRNGLRQAEGADYVLIPKGFQPMADWSLDTVLVDIYQ